LPRVLVNAAAPGVVETEMSNFTKTEAGREVTLNMQALKRIAQPDDIAPWCGSWLPMMHAGSPASPFTSTAVPSSEAGGIRTPDRRHLRRSLGGLTRMSLTGQRDFGGRQSILTPPTGGLPVMSAECSSKRIQRRVPDPLSDFGQWNVSSS
jgi:hypothetical protein